MWKFAIIFIILQLTLTVNADPKCTAWIKDVGKKHRCCKHPFPITEENIKTMSKLNLTFCEHNEKVAELLNLKNADKSAYKGYLTKTINDSEWQSIFVKNVDFCMDLVPELVSPFAKKINITEEGCGAKFLLTVNCLMISAYLDCPAKYYTDSSECKELTKTLNECQQNTDDIIEAFNTIQ